MSCIGIGSAAGRPHSPHGGEPGKGSDAIRFQLYDPGAVLAYDSLTDFPDNDLKAGCVAGDNVGQTLSGGNLQIHSRLKN